MRLNICIRPTAARLKAALSVLMISVFSIGGVAQITLVSDNFNDGDITAAPVWSGQTSAYTVSTSSPLEGSHSMRGNTNNVKSVISTQYGTATNLSTANYNWTLLYRDNGSANPDALNSGAAITAGTNHWRFWIAASTNDPSTANGIYLSHSAGNLKITRKRNKNNWDIATYPISLNTTYSIKVSRRNDGFITWYIDTGTAEAATARGDFWVTDVLASGSSNIFMLFESNNTAANVNRFQWDLAGMFSKNLTITQLTNGVHNGDLEQGMTNKALIGFAATSVGAVNIETVRIQNTNSNSSAFSNIKFYTSTDDSYATAADNTEVTGAVVDPNGSEFIISNINHTLTNETRNYFLVVDVPQTGYPPADIQLSMSCVDCGAPFTNVETTNEEKVFDFSFSTINYNFLRVFTWNNTTTVGDFTDDWQSANAWTPWGGPPSANDVVIFSKGGSVTPLNIPTQSVKRIVIRNNTTVNINTSSLSGGSRTLTLSGSAEDDLVIEAGSSLNITSTGNTLALVLGSGATANIAGALNFSGKNHSLSAPAASAINFVSGGSFTGGTGLTGNPFGSAVAGSVVFNSGATLEDRAALDYFTANNVIVLQPGSLYRHNSSTNAALNNKTFGDIEISTGASLSAAANTYNIAGSLSGAGALSLTTGVVNISGDFTTTGSLTTGTGTFNLTGSDQSLRGGVYHNLNLSGTGTKTASADVTVNGTLNLAATTIMNLGNSALSGSLNTISNAGIIRTANQSSSPIPAGKNWGGTIEYTAGGQTVITGTYNNLLFSNSGGTNSASGNLIVNGTFTHPANSTLDLGAYTLSGSLTSISNEGTIRTANTTATPIAAGKTWGGTVEFTAATGSQSVVSGNYNNILFSNASGTNNATGNLVVNGSLTNPVNSIFNLGSFALSGTLNTVSNNGTIRTANTSSAPLPASKTWDGTVEYYSASGGQTVANGIYSDLVFSNASGTNTAGGSLEVNNSLVIPANSTLNLAGNIFSGNLNTISNSGTIRTANITAAPIPSGKSWGGTILYDAATGGQTIVTGSYNNLVCGNTGGTNTASGDIVVSGGLTNPTSSVLDLNVYTLSGSLATINNSGTIRTYSTSAMPLPTGKSWGGTIEFAATGGGQTIVYGTYNALELKNTSGSNVAAGDLTVNASLTTTAGGTLSMGTYVLAGSMVTLNHNGSIETANTATTPLPPGKTWGGSVIFNGTAAQSIPTSTFNNFELNNTAGAAMEGSLVVNGSFSLSNGKLSLGAKALAINGTLAAMSVANCFTGSSSASLSIGGSGVLGTLYFDQSLPDTTNALKDFVINRSNLSGAISLGNELRVTGTVTPTAGTLNTGGFLTLASSATGTARILTINPAMFALNGQVAAERYFTSKTSRRWIFVASPVADVSFRSAWQDDIFITGPGTGGTICGSGGNGYNSNGFDATVLNAHTIYTYDQNLSARWAGIPNTTGTNLQKGKGYRVMVRGERTNCADQLISQSPAAPVPTVIRATGTLTTGNVPVNISAKTTGTYGYTLIGNPYACEIDFSSFQSFNNSVISNKYWTYDPASTSTNYLVYNNGIVAGNNPSGTVTDDNGYLIAPGQAFFVESINGGTATFTEAHKTGIEQKGVFKTNAVKRIIRTTFTKADGSFIDNMVVRFSDEPGVSTAENPYWDAVTMNSGNFIAGIKGMKSFAIQTRPLDFMNDTVWVRIVSSATGDFKLKFSEYAGLSQAAEIILLDLYNGTQHNVRANPEYSFSITSNTATQGGRFKLVFRSLVSVMPVRYLDLKAKLKSTLVELDWKVAFEQDVVRYVVERSADGRQFTAIGVVASKGNSNVPAQYDFIDANPLTGGSYYRIRSQELEGPDQLSMIAAIDMENNRPGLFAYPNPAKDRLQVQIPGKAGSYTLSIRNSYGSVLQQISIKATNPVVDISQLQPGLYYITVQSANGESQSARFIKQ